MDNKNFHNVSLGQGQEVVAESALDVAAEKGHWVILQNIHLVAKWLMTLQNKIEKVWGVFDATFTLKTLLAFFSVDCAIQVLVLRGFLMELQ